MSDFMNSLLFTPQTVAARKLALAKIQQASDAMSAQSRLNGGADPNDPTGGQINWNPQPMGQSQNVTLMGQPGQAQAPNGQIVAGPMSQSSPSQQIPRTPEALMGAGMPQDQVNSLMNGSPADAQRAALLRQANPEPFINAETSRAIMGPAIAGMTLDQQRAFMLDPKTAAEQLAKTAIPELTPQQKVSDALAKMSPDDPRRPALQAYLDKEGYIREKDPLIIAQTKAATANDEAGAKQKGAETTLAEARAKALADNAISDDAVEFRAQLAMAGDTDSAFKGLPSGMLGSAARAKVTDRWAALAQEGGVSGDAMNKIKMQQKAANAALGQVAKRASAADYNANEMSLVGDQLKTASEAVDRTGWTDLNNLTNYAKSHTSNPEYGQLDVAVQGFKTAFAQALSRNGVPTDQGRAKADALFSGARSHADLMARVAQAQKEAGAVIQAGDTTKKQIIDGIGSKPTAATNSAVTPVQTIRVFNPKTGKLE